MKCEMECSLPLNQALQEPRAEKLSFQVIVVEGNTHSCDMFVTWVKGNKSRPGGFGRNWGHHVRGEATVERRQLPESFEELDDLAQFGALCKKAGVEEEFREFILQHK